MNSNNSIHLVNLIIGYFKNINVTLDINNNRQLTTEWFKISNDLISLLDNINSDSISNFKLKHSNQEFIDIVQNEFQNNKTSSNIVRVQLNELYIGAITDCKRIELKKYYATIFKNLWVNGFITLGDEKLGIILYNIIDAHDSLSEILSLHNKKTYLNFYINFLYSLIATKRLNYTINNINNVDLHNDIIVSYSNFITEKFFEKFSKYIVYYDIDVIHVLDVNEPDNNNAEIFSFFKKYIFDSTHSINIKNNVISLFLAKKKYVYFYNNNVNYVGIKRIDPNDKNLLLKHTRSVKLNKIFEE